MRKHGGTPSWRDKHVTLAAISRPGVAQGRFVGGQQSGLAGCKPPPLLTRGASCCSSQGRRQGEPWGASPRPSAPTYLPTWWVASVVGVSVVGEAAVVGVSVGAGDGVAGCADGGGWEGGPVSWWFLRVSWLSVDGAALGGVLEGGAGVGRECCRQCSGFSACGSWS